MGANNSLPAYGRLQATLSSLFVNDSSAPVSIRMLKLTNNSSSLRTISIYLNSSGVRTPLLPEGFQLNAGYMASDDLVLNLRKSDAIEGFADATDSVAYILS